MVLDALRAEYINAKVSVKKNAKIAAAKIRPIMELITKMYVLCKRGAI